MREIIVGDQVLPIYFGMRALSEFAKSTGKEFSEVLSPANTFASLEAIVEITVPALNEGARQSGESKRYIAEDVYLMLDADPTLLLTISSIFMESVTPIMERMGSMSPAQHGEDSAKKK